MAGWTEAEKKFCRPHFDDVAIAEDCMFDRLAIDKTQRTGLNGEDEPFGRLQCNLKMAIPNTIFFQPQFRLGRAPDPDRKTAGD